MARGLKLIKLNDTNKYALPLHVDYHNDAGTESNFINAVVVKVNTATK